MSRTLHKGITCILLVTTMMSMCCLIHLLVKFEALETAHYKALEELRENVGYKVIEIPVPSMEYFDEEEPEDPFDFNGPI